MSGSSAPAGYRFPHEVIAVAVRWYLRYGLAMLRNLLAERGIEVNHVTVYRWVQTFTAQFIDTARPARHAVGDQWFVEDLRQGRPPVDLPRPGGRPTRPSHRCARVNPPRRGSRTKILRPCAAPRSGSGRSRDRPSTNVPAPGRGAGAAAGTARHRAVREQRDRGRPWSLKARLRPLRGLARPRTPSRSGMRSYKPAPRPLRDHRRPWQWYMIGAHPAPAGPCKSPVCTSPIPARKAAVRSPASGSAPLGTTRTRSRTTIRRPTPAPRTRS
jgi:hypothetical protein